LLEGLLFASIEVWEGSGGAFDITVGPLIDLWRQAASNARWPTVESLRRAKRRIGSGRLLLPGDGEVGVTATGMRIDLDGISKGAVLDRLRERLDARLPDAAALLSFGQSSILAIGDPDPGDARGGWRLEIRSRGPRGERLGVVRLRDRALSVSSSVGSVSEIEGQPVSHVVDPRTGGPVEGTVEAVVVSDRAALADGWSTALLVLGADRMAIRLVSRAGLEAIVYGEGGPVVYSQGWDALIAKD
jgi:thiamine biosynthesis lipoprotein